MKIKLLVFILFSILLSSCREQNLGLIKQVNYGTSFGECIGYCKHDIALTSNEIIYKCSSSSVTENTIIHTEILDVQTWDSICNDFDLENFLALPEVIGCPDCADGGAEWLEIIFSTGKTHKVTFEYYSEPTSLKSKIEILRRIANKHNCN